MDDLNNENNLSENEKAENSFSAELDLSDNYDEQIPETQSENQNENVEEPMQEYDYYVHKSDGYIPPSNDSNFSSYNMGEQNSNENPYDHANGVFTGGQVPPRKSNKGLSIAAMVFGIVSVVLGCCGHLVTVCLAIAGLTCGIVAEAKGPNGFALAGIITSAFGLVFGIIGVAMASSVIEEFESWMEGVEGFPENSDGMSGNSSSSSSSLHGDAFINPLFYIKLFFGL